MTLVVSVFQLIYNALNALEINLPSLPESVTSTLTLIQTYLVDGVNILHLFIGDTAFASLRVLLLLVVLLEPARITWSFFVTVLRKIPWLHAG